MVDTSGATITPKGRSGKRVGSETGRAEIERRDGLCDEVGIFADRLYRLSVDQYHAMARAGILTENDNIELIEGWLVRKMTKYPPHAISTVLVREALHSILPDGWFVNSQDPITTGDSEPEPDGFVVRGSVRDYRDGPPGPRDLALVVEVADTSLAFDRGTKKRLYARARIITYWIVNLNQRQIEVYTRPTGTGRRADYRERRDYAEGDRVPLIVNEVAVAELSVADLLP